MTDDLTGEPLIRRSDDNPDALRKRLATYSELTAPLVDYYGNMKLLTTVDAKQKPDSVYERIKEAISKAKAKDFVTFV